MVLKVGKGFKAVIVDDGENFLFIFVIVGSMADSKPETIIVAVQCCGFVVRDCVSGR